MSRSNGNNHGDSDSNRSQSEPRGTGGHGSRRYGTVSIGSVPSSNFLRLFESISDLHRSIRISHEAELEHEIRHSLTSTGAFDESHDSDCSENSDSPSDGEDSDSLSDVVSNELTNEYLNVRINDDDRMNDDTPDTTGIHRNAEQISFDLNNRSRNELRRSETRRDGLTRQNAIKRLKPNRLSLDETIKQFFVDFAEDIQFLSDKVNECVENDPILSCFKNHYEHRLEDYSKEMDSILYKSQEGSLYITKKRKLATPSPRKRLKGSKSKVKSHYTTSAANSDKEEMKEVPDDYKQHVVNVSYSSFLAEGSSFDMKYCNTVLNFFVISVDYHKKEVEFLVTVKPNEKVNYMQNLAEFLQFFYRDFETDHSNIQQLIDKLKCPDNPQVDIKHSSKLFNFIVPGILIDFRSVDLRTDHVHPTIWTARWSNLPPFNKSMLTAINQMLLSATISTGSKAKFEHLHGALSGIHDFRLAHDIPHFKFDRFEALTKRSKEIRHSFTVDAVTLSDIQRFEGILVCKDCLFNIQSHYIPFTLNIESSVIDSLLRYIEEYFTLNEETTSLIKQCTTKAKKTPYMWMGTMDRSNGNMSITTSTSARICASKFYGGGYHVDKAPSRLSIHGCFTSFKKNSFTTGGGHQTYKFL